MEREKQAVTTSPQLDVSQTVAQSSESKNASQQLSEFHDLSQNPEAPKIKGYMLLKPIGKGAYAQVWEALQLHTRKFVAVKVFTKKSGIHWFFLQREVERLVRLDKHPHIVSLLDADLSGEVPYYVMDLAETGSLDKVLQMEKTGGNHIVDLEKVADWLKEIAQALHYVHSKQMVHCDLKPANVLLDEEGHVRVADFGHSRVLSESGGSLGTLFFMAPEQAILPEGVEPLMPRVQWDIYAFGCTAYAILSGHVPHEEIEEALKNLPRLGDRLKLYREAIETQSLPALFEVTQGRVDRDLSAIIDKCMKVHAEERYRTMEEVLSDLKARREERPVSPLARDKRYWIGKFLSRQRIPAGILGAAAFLILLTLFSSSNTKKIQVGDAAMNDALKGLEFMEKGDDASAAAFFAASSKISPSLLAQGNADRCRLPIPRYLLAHEDGLLTVAFSLDGKTLLTASAKSGARLWDAATGRPKGSFLKMPGPLVAAILSPHASRLALLDSEGTVQLWNLESPKPSGKPLPAGMPVVGIAFSQDGKKLVTAGGDGEARVWNASNGEPLTPPMRQGRALILAGFSPDGKIVFTCGKEGIARLWDAQRGRTLGDPIRIETENAPVWYKPDIAFSPDSRVLVTTGWDGGLRFYDDRGHRQGRPIFLEGVGAKAVFSPDGDRILAAAIFRGAMGTARVVSLKNRLPLKFHLRSPGRITVLAFSPDGQMVLTGGMDNAVRFWDARSGRPLGKVLWHTDRVTAAAFEPEGNGLMTGSQDGLGRYWSLEAITDSPARLAENGKDRAGVRKYPSHALYSHDGRKILTYAGKTAYLWDGGSGDAVGPVLKGSGTILRAIFSPDDQFLLTCQTNQEARLWNLKTRGFLNLPLDGVVRGGAFNADGKQVITATEDGVVRLWDTASGQPLTPPIETGVAIAQVVLSPDGEEALVMGLEGSLRLYAGLKKSLQAPAKAASGVHGASFSPDGNWVLAVDGLQADLWDASNGKPVRTFKQGKSLSFGLFGPDGKRVVTMGTDGTATLWDAVTGKPTADPLKHAGPALEAVFSPQGEVLAVAYQDGTYRLWDTKTGEPIGREVPLGIVQAMGFAADGNRLGFLGKNGEILFEDTPWIGNKADPDKEILASEVAGLCRVNDNGSLEQVPVERWIKLWRQWGKENKRSPAM